MVREFADLEGTMGMTYAAMEGFPAEVAQAIREQFLPDAAEVRYRDPAGSLLATAEKVDNIVAAFACAEPPTGSRTRTDCVRRHGHGQHRLRPGLRLSAAPARRVRLRGPWRPQPSGAKRGRGGPGLEFVFGETGEGPDRSRSESRDGGAVLPTSDGFLDLRARALALDEARHAVWFDDLMVVYTRPSNLAKKLPPDQAGPGKPRSSPLRRKRSCTANGIRRRRGPLRPRAGTLPGCLADTGRPSTAVAVLRRGAGHGEDRPSAPTACACWRQCGLCTAGGWLVKLPG